MLYYQGISSLSAEYVPSSWGPSGSCRPQVGPMLAPWTLLSGYPCLSSCFIHRLRRIIGILYFVMAFFHSNMNIIWTQPLGMPFYWITMMICDKVKIKYQHGNCYPNRIWYLQGNFYYRIQRIFIINIVCFGDILMFLLNVLNWIWKHWINHLHENNIFCINEVSF